MPLDTPAPNPTGAATIEAALIAIAAEIERDTATQGQIALDLVADPDNQELVDKLAEVDDRLAKARRREELFRSALRAAIQRDARSTEAARVRGIVEARDKACAAAQERVKAAGKVDAALKALRVAIEAYEGLTKTIEENAQVVTGNVFPDVAAQIRAWEHVSRSAGTRCISGGVILGVVESGVGRCADGLLNPDLIWNPPTPGTTCSGRAADAAKLLTSRLDETLRSL